MRDKRKWFEDHIIENCIFLIAYKTHTIDLNLPSSLPCELFFRSLSHIENQLENVKCNQITKMTITWERCVRKSMRLKWH